MTETSRDIARPTDRSIDRSDATETWMKPPCHLKETLVHQPGLHRMLSIKEVREVVPLSTRQIDRLIRQGLFPEPIFISPNRRAWSEPKIRQFLRECELSGQSRRAYSTRNCRPVQEESAMPVISENSPKKEADHG